MKLINATPHQITILSRTGVEQDAKKQFLASASEIEVLQKIEPSGILPRVAMTNKPVEPIAGIPVEEVTYGEIEGLPELEHDVYYIVSGLVAQAAVKLGRCDCLAPGALVRDKDNSSNVLGCLFLQKP